MDVSEILTELNDHGFEDTPSSRKVAILNDTIADVCSREPWPFLEKELTLTFNGTDAFPSNWPSDFSKMIGISNTDGSSLTWSRWADLRKQFRNTLTQGGAPLYFYFVKSRVKLYPVPGSGTALNLEYVCWHPEVAESTLEASILIPSRHHRIIVVGTLSKLYAMEDDPELSALFKATYDERLRVMREDLLRDQYVQTDSILVFEDDYLDEGYYH